MKLLAAVLAASILAACSRPAAPPAAGPSDVAILASDGAVLRPIANGGRVPLREGWATIRISPVPPGADAALRVSVFGSDGHEAAADVSVDYASLDMDHGHTVERGVLHEGCYEMPLAFAMPGRWRLVIHVVRAGAEETVTLLLPEVGM